MREKVIVDAVMEEKTFVGKVSIPVSMPQGLTDYFAFPEDVFVHAKEMGLDSHAVKFLMAACRGKWMASVILDLNDLALKTGMKFSVMDEIVRDLIEKNYARINGRLDLFRLWIVLLHVKGVEFDVE